LRPFSLKYAPIKFYYFLLLLPDLILFRLHTESTP
jgi:hypothetical protein